jgi:hypothetical protein
MSRTVNMVILCEDRQHEAFARRFLRKAGIATRDLRVEIIPQGRGAAEQFVRDQYLKELQYYRSRSHRVQQALLVMIDADGRQVTARISQVEQEAAATPEGGRGDGERVSICVPARNIETWFAYLDGQDVNEDDRYPRLARERECQRHVDALYEMCRQGMLRQPSPPLLVAACDEYRLRVQT